MEACATLTRPPKKVIESFNICQSSPTCQGIKSARADRGHARIVERTCRSLNARAMKMNPMPSTQRSVDVTLIHGTYARGAAWTRGNGTANIRTEIQSRVGDKCSIHVEDWD